MRYINKLTGAIIETVCKISGEDWEVQEIEADEVEKPKNRPNKKDKEE